MILGLLIDPLLAIHMISPMFFGVIFGYLIIFTTNSNERSFVRSFLFDLQLYIVVDDKLSKLSVDGVLSDAIDRS
jgi:hypothetical protein